MHAEEYIRHSFTLCIYLPPRVPADPTLELVLAFCSQTYNALAQRDRFTPRNKFGGMTVLFRHSDFTEHRKERKKKKEVRRWWWWEPKGGGFSLLHSHNFPLFVISVFCCVDCFGHFFFILREREREMLRREKSTGQRKKNSKIKMYIVATFRKSTCHTGGQ